MSLYYIHKFSSYLWPFFIRSSLQINAPISYPWSIEISHIFGSLQLLIAAVVAVAAAAPSDLSYERDIIEILRQNIDHNDDHSYQQS